jgi:hypothetical protein
LTDRQGRFDFSSIPAGSQDFTIKKPGYRDAASPIEFAEGAEEGFDHTVMVAAAMPDLAFSLTPTGEISGRVNLSKGETGQPLTVSLMRKTVQHGRMQWSLFKANGTDDEGQYHFYGVPGGTYTVHVESRARPSLPGALVDPGSVGKVVRENYPSVYYPNARDITDAGQIRLGPGESAEADFNLDYERFYPVTFNVLSADGQPFKPDLTSEFAKNKGPMAAAILNAKGQAAGYAAAYDEVTHTVQATVPNGTYTVTVVAHRTPGAVDAEGAGPAAHGNYANYWAGAATFTVADQPVQDLPIVLVSPNSYPLRISAPGASEGGSAHLGVTVSFSTASTPFTKAGHVRDLPQQQGGSYDLMALPLASIWVHTRVLQNGYCAGGISSEGVNLARETLALGLKGEHAPAVFTLRNDCASLTLALPRAAAKTTSGEGHVYYVYVVPDFDTTEDVDPQTLGTMSEASIAMESLTPGNYHVFTFDRPVEFEYRNPDAVAQLPVHGQPITLAPGSHVNLVVEVPQLP